MPNKQSAAKRVRQAAKARVRNRTRRSAMRLAIREVREIADAPVVDAAALAKVDTLIHAAQKQIGKASKTRVIKKNTAARLQSRMMIAVNKAKAKAKAAK